MKKAQSYLQIASQQPLFLSYLLVFVVFALTLFFNDGFMGTDEYWTGITRYIPAQTSSVSGLVTTDDVKSPTQLMPFYVAAQAVHFFGENKPYWQYRWVTALLAIINLLVFLKAFSIFFQSAKEKITLNLIFSLHAISAFVFTRPMFEAMAAPWLMLSVAYLFRYDQQWVYFCQTQKNKWGTDEYKKLFSEFSRINLQHLIYALIFFTVAFLLRPQVALCSLLLLALPLWHKDYRSLRWITGCGALTLALTGLPDLFLRGQWHFSIFALGKYNAEHGQDYGGGSWLNYIFLLLAVAWAPFWITKNKPRPEYFIFFRTVFAAIGLFILLHAFFAQKFERFMIPIVPLVFVLITPVVLDYFSRFKQHRWRLVFLLALNMPLFFIAAFFPSQKNIIEVALFLDQHQQIKNVYYLADTPEWIPEAFIEHKNHQMKVLPEKEMLTRLTDASSVGAEDLILVPESWLLAQQKDLLEQASTTKANGVSGTKTSGWSKTAATLVKNPSAFQWEDLQRTEFDVNPIEALAHKFNPKNNNRRIKLVGLWRK